MSDIFRDMQSKRLSVYFICRIRNGRYGMNFVVCPLRDTGKSSWRILPVMCLG